MYNMHISPSFLPELRIAATNQLLQHVGGIWCKKLLKELL